MLRLRGRSSGFTLLELIIVVIVIGILASIALPKYLQVAEKGRIAEAKSMLGSLRAAQMRYLSKVGHFTNLLADLDFQGTTPKYFGGDVNTTPVTVAATTSDATVVGICTRNGSETISGPGANYTIAIEQDGTFSVADAVVVKLI